MNEIINNLWNRSKDSRKIKSEDTDMEVIYFEFKMSCRKKRKGHTEKKEAFMLGNSPIMLGSERFSSLLLHAESISSAHFTVRLMLALTSASWKLFASSHSPLNRFFWLPW